MASPKSKTRQFSIAVLNFCIMSLVVLSLCFHSGLWREFTGFHFLPLSLQGGIWEMPNVTNNVTGSPHSSDLGAEKIDQLVSWNPNFQDKNSSQLSSVILHIMVLRLLLILLFSFSTWNWKTRRNHCCFQTPLWELGDIKSQKYLIYVVYKPKVPQVGAAESNRWHRGSGSSFFLNFSNSICTGPVGALWLCGFLKQSTDPCTGTVNSLLALSLLGKHKCHFRLIFGFLYPACLSSSLACQSLFRLCHSSSAGKDYCFPT